MKQSGVVFHVCCAWRPSYLSPGNFQWHRTTLRDIPEESVGLVPLENDGRKENRPFTIKMVKKNVFSLTNLTIF